MVYIIYKLMPTKSQKLQEILDNIRRQEEKRHPAAKAAREDKHTMTPFGKVWSKLLTIKHTRNLRKGEILAQWIRGKRTGKQEDFLWLGVIEKSEYDAINGNYRIYYRPFVEQDEMWRERIDQISTKQMN